MKKILKKVMATAMTVTILSTNLISVPVNVSASTTDRKIDFSVPAWSWKNPTKPYTKDTNSSVYFYLKSGSASVLVRTHGCTLDSKSKYSWKKNLTLNKNGESVSYVICNIGTEYEIYNEINETGYLYAGIKMKSKGFSDNHVAGAWSPDFSRESGHTYKIAN